MSEAPVSLAFFDPARGLHGIARAGLTLLFEGGHPSAIGAGPVVEQGDDAWRAVLEDRLDLDFAPLAEPARIGGALVRLARVTGTVDGRRIECMGTAAETLEAPRWEELDAVRAVSALFDPEHAALAIARRPRGALGHGAELVSAALVADGELRGVEEARLSTVYDAEGRQRTAGLELWLPGEDFPRRATGRVAAGTTLELSGLRVNASVFEWQMEGRAGAGAYEITIRDEEPEAA